MCLQIVTQNINIEQCNRLDITNHLVLRFQIVYLIMERENTSY